MPIRQEIMLLFQLELYQHWIQCFDRFAIELKLVVIVQWLYYSDEPGKTFDFIDFLVDKQRLYHL